MTVEGNPKVRRGNAGRVVPYDPGRKDDVESGKAT